MILDYNYNKRTRDFNICYIDENGAKRFITKNINRFTRYAYDENGQFEDPWHRRCSPVLTTEPSKHDLRDVVLSLEGDELKKVSGKTYPKLYAFDIETEFVKGEFPDAETAKFPITSISICSPELNVVVFGTQKMSEEELEYCNKEFNAYIDSIEFYKELQLENRPYLKYVYYETEEAMLRDFLSKIVAKVPVLSGWNCIQFDWQYIVNRLKNYYPNVPLYTASCKYAVKNQRIQGRFKEISLPMPVHTQIHDMQFMIADNDHTVIPIKENMTLDWISEQSLNLHKIEYDGDLEDLRKTNFAKYVFYNAIDSVLVSLLDRRFKCFIKFYIYAMYCQESFERVLGMIASSEALLCKYWKSLGYKVVMDPERVTPSAGIVVGAYVKMPSPGIWDWCVCNDFASLYPSTMITCNMSVENYVGHFWKIDELMKYVGNDNYVVTAGRVFENVGNSKKPKAGKQLFQFNDEEALDKYRNDKNYFVSVNGVVYRNDKEYAIMAIQKQLYDARNVNKYLKQRLDAQVVPDIEAIIDGNDKYEFHTYDEGVMGALALIKVSGSNTITKGECFKKYDAVTLKKFRKMLIEDIEFYDNSQLAMKLLMNSIYGGSGNPAFYWYNPDLANDITGEAKNLTKLMESHLGDFFTKNWYKMTDLHKQLGITLKPEYVKEMEKRDAAVSR